MLAGVYTRQVDRIPKKGQVHNNRNPEKGQVEIMKYKVINEELKIAECSLADLTMDQVRFFLDSWGDDCSIGTLTLFFDGDGFVVLNRDNKNYEYFRDLSERYLAADENNRMELREKAPKCIEETLAVLESAIKHRTIAEALFMSRKNNVDKDSRYVLNAICKEVDNSQGIACVAYRYGVICGKRAERARRKAMNNG